MAELVARVRVTERKPLAASAAGWKVKSSGRELWAGIDNGSAVVRENSAAASPPNVPPVISSTWLVRLVRINSPLVLPSSVTTVPSGSKSAASSTGTVASSTTTLSKRANWWLGAKGVDPVKGSS